MKIVEFIFTMDLFTDIDECEPTNPCGDVCSDTTPGYDCSCSTNGTKLDNDQRTCIGKNSHYHHWLHILRNFSMSYQQFILIELYHLFVYGV